MRMVGAQACGYDIAPGERAVRIELVRLSAVCTAPRGTLVGAAHSDGSIIPKKSSGTIDLLRVQSSTAGGSLTN